MATVVIKGASIDDKLCVYGYMRAISAELHILNMPELVITVCLAYYMRIEYFINEREQEDLEYSNDHKTITKLAHTSLLAHAGDYWSLECLANQLIDSTHDVLVVWTLQLTKCRKHGSGIKFGVFNQDEESLTRWRTKTSMEGGNSVRYTLCNSTTTTGKGRVSDRYRERFGQNDVVTFVLDLCKQEIRYTVNGGKTYVIFENVMRGKDIKYKFYASIWFTDDALTILDFSIARK